MLVVNLLAFLPQASITPVDSGAQEQTEQLDKIETKLQDVRVEADKTVFSDGLRYTEDATTGQSTAIAGNELDLTVAVITTFGKVTVNDGKGIQWKVPFIQKVKKVDTTIKGFPISFNSVITLS